MNASPPHTTLIGSDLSNSSDIESMGPKKKEGKKFDGGG